MNRFARLVNQYPRQFWLLFGGMLISASGGSMVWPFLTIYVRQSLGVPLTTVGLLLGIYSGARLVSTFLAGPVADRFGRRGVMLLSLSVGSLVYVAMNHAATLPVWALLMLANGAFIPLFSVGSDAMVADLIDPGDRAGAYALLRMSNNLGVAVGPAIGGFVAMVSYAWTFYSAAAAHLAFALLVLFFVAETLPEAPENTVESRFGGYGHIFRDRPFLAFCGLASLVVIPASLMMVLLPVYAKEQHGVAESQYGFIMTTNAGMVVLLQYSFTQITKRHSPLTMLATGAFFYGVGVGSVALGQGFWAFLLSMVVMTIGEMILVPTATTLTANLSPPDMRGRYMGFYGLTWGLGFGIGPVVGGLLSDQIAPVAIWYGGLLFGLMAAVGFWLLGRWMPKATQTT